MAMVLLNEVHWNNMRNCGNRKDNTSGVKGINWDKKSKKWKAQIRVYGKFYLGCYKHLHNAVLARLAAEQCLGWPGCDSASPAYRYAVKNKLIHTNCNKW